MEKTHADQQVDVADHPVAWRWLLDCARSDPDGFVRLTGGNVKRLTVLLGKADWKNPSRKAWSHAWRVQRHGLTWVIYSGRNSTVFKVVVPDDPQGYLSDPRVGMGMSNTLSDILSALTGQSALV